MEKVLHVTGWSTKLTFLLILSLAILSFTQCKPEDPVKPKYKIKAYAGAKAYISDKNNPTVKITDLDVISNHWVEFESSNDRYIRLTTYTDSTVVVLTRSPDTTNIVERKIVAKAGNQDFIYIGY